RVGDRKFADVVEKSPDPQSADPPGVPAEPQRDRFGEPADARAVALHVGTGIDRLAEPRQHCHGSHISTCRGLTLPAKTALVRSQASDSASSMRRRMKRTTKAPTTSRTKIAAPAISP